MTAKQKKKPRKRRAPVAPSLSSRLRRFGVWLLTSAMLRWIGRHTEPRVLDLELTHASQVRHAGTCVLALPAIPSRRADAVLAAHLRDRQPGLAFL